MKKNKNKKNIKKNVKSLKSVTIEKALYSPVTESNFDIGKGAVVQLHLITQPMETFLKQEYIKDLDCLSGDIITLFELSKKQLQQNSFRE